MMMGSLIHTGTPLGNIDTIKPSIANGNRQYPTALIDWNNDLSILYCYPLLPSSLQFMLMRNAPSQNIMNIFMKSSFLYCFPSPNSASDSAKNMQIRSGPHRSQFFRSFILLYRCLGKRSTTYLILCPIAVNYLIYIIDFLRLFLLAINRTVSHFFLKNSLTF